MELGFNLAWLVAAFAIMVSTLIGLRRDTVRLPLGTALVLAVLVCLLLLPVISVSDDLLADSQAALPLAGQLWHLAAEGTSVGLELGAILSVCLLLLLSLAVQARTRARGDGDAHPISAWLTRSLRLRPPPTPAL